MPTTSRSRQLNVRPERAWAYAADPARLPRWWPQVERVDRSGSEDFTKWVLSPRGRAVAMSFRLAEIEPGRKVVWQQELDGSLFAKSLRSAEERIEVTAIDERCVIELTISRRMKGTARFGSAFIARAQRAEIEKALDSLEGALGG